MNIKQPFLPILITIINLSFINSILPIINSNIINYNINTYFSSQGSKSILEFQFVLPERLTEYNELIVNIPKNYLNSNDINQSQLKVFNTNLTPNKPNLAVLPVLAASFTISKTETIEYIKISI